MTRLRLSKDIYSEKNLSRALNAYEGYGVITVSDTEDSWNLEFNKCKYEETRTVKEFENYLIGLENG